MLEKYIDQFEYYDVFNHIKKSGGTNYIYGAGSLALRIYNRLKENEIEVEGFLVDDCFYRNACIFDIDVVKISEIKRKSIVCNVVIGVADYTLGKNIKRISQVKSVFYIVDAPYKDIVVTNESLKNNISLFEQTIACLADSESVNCFETWIKCGLSGRADYCYPYAKNEQTYFDNDIFRISSQEVLLDIGAYTGDSVELFLKTNEYKFSYIYCVEGDPDNYGKLTENINRLGVGDKTRTFFEICGQTDSRVSFETAYNEKDGYYIRENENGTITPKSIDHLLSQRERVTILKANFPGILSVLRGARDVISEDKPKLAIMAGWGPMLLPELVRFIKSNLPDYKIHLRFASAMPSRIMLLATI
ncbi:MAG: FkbM family methyltransferase [Lachnospiraceae bacterium]|nr:FkbM family methyltransferase [Lachnospiraceae bacterium]